MKRSRIHVLAATLLMILLGLGCDKAAPEKTATASDPAAATPKSETLAHLHWLGKKRLAGETNAAAFLKIWNLPESARLEDQTLDKLATAPWRLLRHATNQPSTPNPQLLLRPLLDDLVQEESYVEIHGITNGPGDMVLALRLPADRAALWQTNLPAVMKSLGAKRADSAKSQNVANTRNLELGTWNWELQNRNSELEGWNLTLARSGDWTLLALGQTDAPAPHASLQAMARRIQTAGVPFAASPTNYWVDLQANLPRVSQAFALGWSLPTNFPQVSLTMIGHEGDVRTRGVLDFPKPLNLQLEPWNIPTNLLDGNLASFTAVRGIRPLLQSWKIWNDPSMGQLSDQFFAWSLRGMLMQCYFAAPLPQASNQVQRLTDWVIKNQARLGTNDVVGFKKSEAFNGLEWAGIPFVSPFLCSSNVSGSDFVVGGFFSIIETNQPVPDELLQFLARRADLVGYDWELTGARSEQCVYISQFVRMACKKAQLPVGSVGLEWLRAAAPQLGFSLTDINQTGASQLSFGRRSTIGFTALELQLLMDWLESPDFPRGLHTFTAKPGASQ